MGVTADLRWIWFFQPLRPLAVTPTSASCGAVSSPLEGEEPYSVSSPGRRLASRPVSAWEVITSVSVITMKGSP